MDETQKLPQNAIRITEVLSYFHEPWYVKWVHKVGLTEANKITKASMKVGSRVDLIIKNPTMLDKKESTEVTNCLFAYKKWLDVYKPKSITPCARLFATIEGHEVTGEPDIMVDDVLVDIKCSSKISLSYWIQVNMYRFLQGNLVDKVGILRLDKVTSSYEYVVKDYDPKLVAVWYGLLNAMVYLRGDDHGDEL